MILLPIMLNIFLIVYWLFFYLLNLSSFPFGGDSSEIATSMSNWGLSHPPGYPLQNLLGNIFIRVVPFYNIYQKTSLFSAIFILLMSVVLISILSLYIKQKQFKIISIIYFLTLFPVWLYGIVPEVFALALFVISSQIYFLLKFEKTREKKYLYLFLIFIGLGVCQHQIFVLFIPGYFYILFKKIKIKVNFELLIKTTPFLLFGLLPYIYAPIVSFFNTSMDMENAKSIAGFLRLILRSSYGTFTAYSGAIPNITNQLVNIQTTFVFLIKDFKPLGLIFVLFGFIYLFKKLRHLYIFFIINILSLLYFYFITNFNLAGSFSMGTFERFLVFLYLNLIIVFAFGFFYIHKILKVNLNHWTNKFLLKLLVTSSLYVLAIALIINSIMTNYDIIKTVNKNKIFQSYGRDVLNSLPKNSYLFLNSDHGIFLVQAAQLIDKIRVDVVRIPSLIGRDYVLAKFKKDNPKVLIPKIKEISKIAEINYSQKNYFYSDKPISKGVWSPNGLTWRYFPDIQEFEKYDDEMVNSNIRYWTKSYSLSPLTQNEKSVFFLDHIYEIYANQISHVIDFLLVYKKNIEVGNILERFYPALKDQYSYQLSYIKYYTQNQRCTNQTELIYSKLAGQQLRKTTDNIYLTNYVQLCKKERANQANTNLQNKEIR